jgi:hypothetical protein
MARTLVVVLIGFILGLGGCAPAPRDPTRPAPVSRREPPRWPALQNPWGCVAGTSVTISGTIIELGTTTFVMDTIFRLVKVDLTGWRAFGTRDLMIGDDVVVQGAVQHGSFAQPWLDAQLVSVNRLVRTFSDGARAADANALLVPGRPNC